MGSLITEAARWSDAEAAKKRERVERNRQATIDRYLDGFMYAFGEGPDRVAYDEKAERVVAEKDGLRFVSQYESSIESWRTLVTCLDCGVEYVGSESLGALRDHYGGRFDTTAEKRRARAIEGLAKQLAKGGLDSRAHACYASEVEAVFWQARIGAGRLKTTVSEMLRLAAERAAEKRES